MNRDHIKKYTWRKLMQILLRSIRMAKRENVRGFSREGKQWRRQERDKDPQRVCKTEEEMLTSYPNGIKSGLHIHVCRHHTTRKTRRNTPKETHRPAKERPVILAKENDKWVFQQEIRTLTEDCSHLQISESSPNQRKIRLKVYFVVSSLGVHGEPLIT